jgi:hypothetical protein
LGLEKEVEGVDLAVPYWPRKMGTKPKNIAKSYMIKFSVFLQDSNKFLPNYGALFLDFKDGFIDIGIAFGQ